jgi:hypothetical protein
MKTIIFSIALVFSVSMFANNGLTVSESSQAFSSGSLKCLKITLNHSNEKDVYKFLKSELKSWKGKVQSKDELFIDDAKMKAMGDNTFDAYLKVEGDEEKGLVTIYMAVDLGGAYLSSGSHPDQYRIMEQELISIAKGASKDGLNNTIKDQNKELKDLEKTQEDMVKSKEKLEKEIEDMKQKIEENEKAIEENVKAQAEQKLKIEGQQEEIKKTETIKESIK